MAPTRRGCAAAPTARRIIAGTLAIAATAAFMMAAASAGAARLRLTAVMARRAIRAVLADDHAETKVNRCRRASVVSITCSAVQEVFTPASESSPAVYELLEGRFRVTLKHDHGMQYMRVHEVN